MQQNIHGGDIYSRQIRLDFSVNGNPLGMPDAAVQAIHEAVQHVGEYPDITAAALTEAVSRMLSGECGREIPKEYLLFGNGASELFLAVVHALKPRNIVIPVPSFYGYEYVAEEGREGNRRPSDVLGRFAQSFGGNGFGYHALCHRHRGQYQSVAAAGQRTLPVGCSLAQARNGLQ